MPNLEKRTKNGEGARNLKAIYRGPKQLYLTFDE